MGTHILRESPNSMHLTLTACPFDRIYCIGLKLCLIFCCSAELPHQEDQNLCFQLVRLT